MSLMAELEPLVEGRPAKPGTLSRAESAYVQAIYEMAEDDLTVAQARLAERLGVSRPAVSQMMQRLGRQGAVEVRGRSVRLSAHGQAHAESAVRRHRLIERLLTDRLGLGAAEAHAEADRLEHAMSPSVDDALDHYLGHPTTCPHGNPIPGSGYRIPNAVSLISAPSGYIVYVERIPERLEVTPGVLDLLERIGLLRGARATMLAADDNSARVRNARGDEFAVPLAIATHLLVRIGGPER
jgi:DtxR family transcriptional regulator, Mn-dependent transcriptional regulator